MWFSSRLIVSLIAAIAVVAFLFAYSQVEGEKQRLRNDLEVRAEILAESLQQTVEPLLAGSSERELRRVVERFSNRERLAGVVVYNARLEPVASSPGVSPGLERPRALLLQAISGNKAIGQFFRQDSTYMHVCVVALHREDSVFGALALFHNARFIENQSARLWRTTLLRVLTEVILIVAVTLLLVRWSIIGPMARTAQWLRELRTGTRSLFRRTSLPESAVFPPLAREVNHLVRSLESARAAAQQEARLREAGESLWTAERLRVHVRGKLQGSPLLVVSNREPYAHVRRGKSVEAMVPASGLVTALEPVLRACGGTWIAHGSGDADRETVDNHDRLRVPPDEPGYTLRRVWLTKEEEQGYYYGFANEGLWPLCHIAHTRPLFRADDWGHYQAVNRKFAAAVLEELAHTEQPLLLVQDYHFALLPRLLKEARPDARVAIFWHIPWPNPQAFEICPWEKELLDGLLGADLVGFHIQAHCNNFLESVDSALESQIEWERFAVNRGGHLTFVRPFPISVDFDETSKDHDHSPAPPVDRTALLRELGVTANFMGVGVDRVDYTKGILERFRGVERFLEKWPDYRSKFTFVQIGAPSRTHINRYHDLLGEVGAEADRINWRFQTSRWKPIVLLTRHHSHKEILPYYRAADLCLVTSLHDGMNLVAKEFVAAREDEQGALILSRFTGASRELRDALIVNPYDTEQLAAAIWLALEMDAHERRSRMRRLRQAVRENNVYHWAGSLIAALSEIRTAKPETVKSRGA